MKRDMDLCRRILLDLEANPEATGANAVKLRIEDRDPAEVNYHVRLLMSGGFIEAALGTGVSGQSCTPKCLTYAGHEFIELCRKDTFWEKAKNTLMEKSEGLSFDVLKAFLVKLATDAVFRGGA
jgi:hypothetical protein